MDLGLTGKRAVVLGASRGIGRATALQLAEEGASLAICARGQKGLEDVVGELTARGAEVFHKQVDVVEQGAVRSFIEDVATALGGIDLLVSNVSAGAVKGPDRWETSFRTDLLPLDEAITAVTPVMQASGGGAIVSLSTTFAFDTSWPNSPSSYSAMKAAALQYVSATAEALASKGIRINVVSPGPIDFPGGDWDKVRSARPETYERVLGLIPIERYGTPEEIAAAITFLLSSKAGFCVGANLICDGGMTRWVHV